MTLLKKRLIAETPRAELVLICDSRMRSVSLLLPDGEIFQDRAAQKFSQERVIWHQAHIQR